MTAQVGPFSPSGYTTYSVADPIELDVDIFSSISSDCIMNSDEESIDIEVRSFNQIPSDLAITIASFLNVDGLESAKKVCRAWKLVFQNTFLETIHIDSCRLRVDTRSYIQRAAVKVESVMRRPPMEMRLTKRTKLDFDGDFPASS